MSIVNKLKLNADQPLWLLEAPGGIQDLLADITIKTTIAPKESVNQALFFTVDNNTLDKKLPKLLKSLAENALVWIAYPKKSSGIITDLDRDRLAIAVPGYMAVTLVALNEQWSAIRFRKEDTVKDPKRSVPMAERKTEGIDYVGRTVTLPKDAEAALKPAGLVDFFYKMAFSHKKEYAEAIADAKKPETRQRRIEAMVTKLSAMQAQKKKK